MDQPEIPGVVAPRWLLDNRTPARTLTSDLLIIGGGAAGLAAALRAAERASVTLLTHGALPQSNSAWAQGGIAAALASGDTPALHVADTLIAGAGLSDPVVSALLAQEAPALMHDLAALGVPLDTHNGMFDLGLEGGHSQRRIVHAADATGHALIATLAACASAHPRITIVERCHLVDLLGTAGSVSGALALDADGVLVAFHAAATILATGGAGALYGLTSNHPWAVGEGIAAAYRAGAEVADMEFVQFHPTVFRTRAERGFLLSEALRGEGALLLSPAGERFMPAYDPRAELAPRDIVARGIAATMRASGADHVLLDARPLGTALLAQHFPTISARLRAEGLDPACTPIPVAPAAHYLMGGIRTDASGATTLRGLFAAGECACTGVHGANRLASNSLLECLVFGRRAADAALRAATPAARVARRSRVEEPTSRLTVRTLGQIQQLMRAHVGLLRDGVGLQHASTWLAQCPQTADAYRDQITVANAALCARLITAAALARSESRGAHSRSDFPASDPAWQQHIALARGRAIGFAPVRSSVTPQQAAA